MKLNEIWKTSLNNRRPIIISCVEGLEGHQLCVDLGNEIWDTRVSCHVSTCMSPQCVHSVTPDTTRPPASHSLLAGSAQHALKYSTDTLKKTNVWWDSHDVDWLLDMHTSSTNSEYMDKFLRNLPSFTVTENCYFYHPEGIVLGCVCFFFFFFLCLRTLYV